MNCVKEGGGAVLHVDVYSPESSELTEEIYESCIQHCTVYLCLLELWL